MTGSLTARAVSRLPSSDGYIKAQGPQEMFTGHIYLPESVNTSISRLWREELASWCSLFFPAVLFGQTALRTLL